MKLLTKEIIRKLEKTRYDKEKPTPNDAPVLVRFFNPTGIGTWSALEGEKQPDGDWRFFGVADLGFPEYGYFSLKELSEFKGNFGLGIERDMYYTGTKESLDKEYGLSTATKTATKTAKKDKPKKDKPKKEVSKSGKKNTAKELLEIYERNEDLNFHSENAKLLADNFGTPAQQKKMNEILDRQLKSSTGISDEDYKWRTKNIDPLYQELLNQFRHKGRLKLMQKKLSDWELVMAEHREYSSKKDLKAYLPKRDPAYIRYKRKIDEGRDKF